MAGIVGVCSPMPKSTMTEEEQERRERLDEKLKDKLDLGRSTPWWPRCDWVDEDKRDWDSRLWDLHQECEAKDGEITEITEYFVEKFTEIAEKAIPIIDEIEGGKP